ncbi:CopG family transcriptional regulator (plasmid) [Rhizobium sp. CB3171]|uniref:CopG family transcriptional regulator n=1 Tax=Rhizobium sp. CB3171 TaxID=3039157 RepID=UPI0024B26889|nr:CopG family transcriptional regulator [Rhizobium sp. CB3171]WFU04573.1 CopG family transcriptional regulator [Rhizobium sp. CB3171]
MTTRDHASVLEDAANRIGDISRADLQILLRRSAIMLRNTGSITLDPAIDDADNSIADELGKTRNDMIRYIIQEWLDTNAYLPVRMLDEDARPKEAHERRCSGPMK